MPDTRTDLRAFYEEHRFILVPSFTREDEGYTIKRRGGGWQCTCLAWLYKKGRPRMCKHILWAKKEGVL